MVVLTFHRCSTTVIHTLNVLRPETCNMYLDVHLTLCCWFRDENIDQYGMEENYCRNPDMDPGGPWCIVSTLDDFWEYCDVPDCGKFLLMLIISFLTLLNCC